MITHCCLEPHGTDHRHGRAITSNCGPPRRMFPASRRPRQGARRFPSPMFTSRWNTSAADSAASFRRTSGAWKPAQLSKASGGKPGKAVPRPRHRIDDRRQPPLGFRAGQSRRRRRTAPSPPGNRSPGRPAASAAEAKCAPVPVRVHEVPNRRMNHTAFRSMRAARAPGARPIIRRPASSPAPRSRIWRPSSAWTRWTVFLKNLNLTSRADVYQVAIREGRRNDRLEETLASARRSGSGPVKRGLGLGDQHLGRRRACQPVPHHHQSGWLGGVEIGTQDLGTGTRTIITMVAAETLGLPMGAITLKHRRQRISALGWRRAAPPPSAAFPPPPANPASTRWKNCSTWWRRRWA